MSLQELAARHGVWTSYDDWRGQRVQVADEAVRLALGAMGVDASTDEAVLEALRAPVAEGPPPVVVLRGPGSFEVVAGSLPRVHLEREDGVRVELSAVDLGGRFRVDVPELPLGYHTAVTGDRRTAVIVVPESAPQPPTRLWGWQVQLYAMRSERSWGIGDYGDLRTLAEAAAGDGASVLLVNPLHAETPVLPLQDSPYSPSSRLFRSAVHLRVQDCPEWDPSLEALRPPTDPERVDRQTAWTAKLAALEAMWPRHRAGALAQFRAERGEPLERFAQFCAHAEVHGADWRQWPELGVPDPERVSFWCWVQLLVDEQLRAMPLGVMHDLAVGVDPGGADAWVLQDVLALDAHVGAPPDMLAQRGQDWGLPPWRPDRLRALAYQPFVDMVRSVLRHAGGIRVDHVLGLSRLWWVPAGRPASDGTYVSYDVDALLGILALEATRAGAVVVGEDLGTVEPSVRAALESNGVLGSEVLWFAQSDGWFLPPSQWRAGALASVTTHDLPTAAGWLSGSAVELRIALGQVAGDPDEERTHTAHERQMLRAMLEHEGLLGDDDDEVLALHRALVTSPCRVVLAAYADAVGDLRQPNVPGTVDEHPNWRLPLADAQGDPLTLEQVLASDGVRRLTDVLRRVR